MDLLIKLFQLLSLTTLLLAFYFILVVGIRYFGLLYLLGLEVIIIELISTRKPRKNTIISFAIIIIAGSSLFTVAAAIEI
jgi:membrane-bound ClpP family serine protease